MSNQFICCKVLQHVKHSQTYTTKKSSLEYFQSLFDQK